MEKQVLLKSGQQITIRVAVAADAARLTAMVKSYLADSAYLPRTPEEFNLTPVQQEQWIRSFAERDNSLMLVAVKDGEMIGNIDLGGSDRQALQHTAVIGMGMLKSWQNRGLGTALMEAAIGWARQQSLLELLWLQVYADNEAGRALYRKMGFVENGTIKRFFKREGFYSDVVTMSLDLR